MKAVINILLSFILLAPLLAERRIENIKISNSGYYKIAIYLSENSNYEVKTSDKCFKIYLSGFSLSEKFPGSLFSFSADEIKDISFKKTLDNGTVINLNIGETAEYIVQSYPNSAILEISIFSIERLSEKDKLFIKALKFENNGEKEKALLEYRKLLSSYPSHSDGLFHAGLLRKSLGYNYQSKANLNASLSAGNIIPEVSYNLSETYKVLGEEEKAIKANAEFKRILDIQKKEPFDSTNASVESVDIFALAIDSSFLTTVESGLDSSDVLAQRKPIERKIIKTIPVDTSSYYYSIAANALVAIIALGSIVYILRLIFKRKIKNKKEDKHIRKNFDIKEKIIHPIEPEFQKMVSSYKSEFDKIDSRSEYPLSNSTNKVPKINDNQVVKSAVSGENDIDRLAKKYQVERGKIELALKIIAKNDTESTKDKYLLLMKMLKENMSLEDLASDLRIPRGELELVMNLKNF